MGHGLIDPDLFVPGSRHLRPAAVRESVGEVRRLGAGVSEHTTAVAEAWAGLSVHYRAPEQEQVLSLMVPAQTAGDEVAQAMGTVAAALEAYADALDPIRRDMLSLERRARAFRRRAADAIEGAADAWFDTVLAVQQENQGLLDEYAVLLGRVSQAVAMCADAVNRVAFPTMCTAPTSVFTADQVMALDYLPWGPPADEKDPSALEQVDEAVRHRFIGGFAAMVGYDTRGERFSRATAGQAWGGTADLFVSVLAMGVPITGVPNATRKPREWIEGQTGWNVSGSGFDHWLGDRQKVVTDTAGSLVGYDPSEGWLWGDKPWLAGTSTALNLATLAVPAAKVGAGAKVVGVAEEAGAGAKVGALASGAARTGAEMMLPGGSWLVHGAQAAARGTGALVRTSQWTAAVDAFRTFMSAGPGRTSAGVAQALADLDKVTPPVGRHPHIPAVSESITRYDPDGSPVSQPRDSWLYQDLPVEPSPAQRTAGTPVREPALVGADPPSASSGRSGGADLTGLAPGHAADAITTQPITGLPRPHMGLDGDGLPAAAGREPGPVDGSGRPGGADPGATEPPPGQEIDAAGPVVQLDEASRAPANYPRPQAGSVVDVTGVDTPGPRTPFAQRTDLAPHTVYRVEGRGDFYTDATGRVTYVETAYGDSALNYDLHRPQPDTTYVVHPQVTDPVPGANHAHVFVTDAEGRTVLAHTDHLALGEARRSESVQSRVGDEGGLGYDGGHMLGTDFGGGGEYVNVKAQLEQVNRGSGDSFFNLENEWRRILADDPDAQIAVDVRHSYPPGSTVPEFTVVDYSVNGGPTIRKIYDNV